jgi:hypothetical protein
MKTLVDHRREILRDAIHAPSTDRFHARLFHGLEYRPGLLTGRLKAAMHGGIVTRKAQGN